MKKIMLLLSLVMFSLSGYSQEIVVDQKDIPPEVLARIKAEKELQLIDDRIMQMGEWAGKGKEIGLAVREALTAVKDVAVDFSGTRVGEFTMILVAWHIIGDDAVDLVRFFMKICIMIPFMIVITILFARSYFKSCVDHRILTKDPGLFKYPKEYEAIDYNGDGSEPTTHVFTWLVMLIISLMIIFL